MGGRNLQSVLQRERVRVGVDQADVVPVLCSQSSGDFEAQCCSRGCWFDRGKSDVPNQPRLRPKEKLLNQRMDLLIVNRNRLRNCFALDLPGNRSRGRPLRGRWSFGKKLTESVH